ncbi:sensor histidine kinase [Lacrimispora defluvii]|uniref:Sensor histidine kinase n=1 Tax=Lacrimispora defluvii TaxID=2719233 RepID=A0ABX1VQN9_9FIRM|nr:sensor histidine kinase [Lacrimispora defluvii]NNJ30414.1 sensor histidine kinase [Lacrimispora defluvii]
MKAFIRNLTLKKKIQSIVFLCILLLTSVSIFNIRMISVAHQRVLYQTVASSLSFSAKELNNHLDVISTMADMVLADSTMQKNLGILKDTGQIQERTMAYKAIYGMLNEYYFNFRRNNIRYMSLYQGNFSIHTHIINKEILPDSIRKDLISRAEAAKGKTILVTDYSHLYGLFMVKNIRRTQFLKLDSIGSLIINIDMKQLIDSSTDNSHLYESADYILYDGDNLIYQSTAFTDKDPSVVSNIFRSRYGLFQSMGKNYFYVRQALFNYNWDYVCIIPYDNILASLTTSFRLSFFITVIAVIISSILSSALIDSIIRHFNNLLLKMKNFADGQKESLDIPYDYTGRTDELGILHTRFDQMVNEVNELIRNGYLNEILRKEAQLKALETQMNPHFLYNTLESINWRAKSVGAKDISSMAENLGTLLRITLDQNSKEVPLRRELELVQCYMTIQKFRYEDRLEYKITVPEDLYSCCVLKLTLQPLVENSIRYGLEENTEGCFIHILAEQISDVLYVYIKNNGSAFEDQLLEKLKTNQISPHGFGIGLLNILQRMQLTYGDEYGLTLYNENEQAVARLAFPLVRKENGKC